MNNFIELISTYLLEFIPKEAIVFIISLLPLLELRGSMIAASILKIPYFTALLISIIGNIIPIPFILFFIEKIINFLEEKKSFNKLTTFLRTKVEKNKNKINKYGYISLILFVGIPLPGTGAWTGALIAALLHMDHKKSILSIFAGIILAAIIMSIISYGIIYNLF